MMIETNAKSPTTAVHKCDLVQATLVPVTVPPSKQAWDPVTKRLNLVRDEMKVRFPVSLQIFQQRFLHIERATITQCR